MGARAGYTFIELVVVIVVLGVSVMIFASMITAGSQQRRINRERAVAANAARGIVESMLNEEYDEVWRLFNADPADDPDGAGTGYGPRFPVAGLNVAPGVGDDCHLEIFFPDQAYELSVGSGGGGPGGFGPLAQLMGGGGGGGGGSVGGGGGGMGLGGGTAGGLDTGNFSLDGTNWDTSKSGASFGGGGLELREDLVLPQLGLPRDLNGDSIVDALDHSVDYILLPVTVRVTWSGLAGTSHFEIYTILTEYRRP